MTEEATVEIFTAEQVEAMSSAERLAHVNTLRQRVNTGVDVPEEEIKQGLLILRIERGARQSSSKSKSKKAVVEATPLSNF